MIIVVTGKGNDTVDWMAWTMLSDWIGSDIIFAGNGADNSNQAEGIFIIDGGGTDTIAVRPLFQMCTST